MKIQSRERAGWLMSQHGGRSTPAVWFYQCGNRNLSTSLFTRVLLSAGAFLYHLTEAFATRERSRSKNSPHTRRTGTELLGETYMWRCSAKQTQEEDDGDRRQKPESLVWTDDAELLLRVTIKQQNIKRMSSGHVTVTWFPLWNPFSGHPERRRHVDERP